MESIDLQPSTLTFSSYALVFSIVSLVLSLAAYWRAGGRRELEVLQVKQRLMAEDLAKWMRKGFEDSLARTARAQKRLAELSQGASQQLREANRVLELELGELKKEAELGLFHLKTEVSSGGHAAQEALAKRIRRIEGSIQVLVARAEIAAAERLAAANEIVQAEDLLEDAVSKVREVRMRLSEEVGDDPAFEHVIETLHDALRSVRARAVDHRRRIESVLEASDSLLASLGNTRPALA
ncbi:MAG: hypothetical protein JWM74_3460 [Myxococcaceae bacterium]|nr:hypothetical protein [Myxococcaceae bacterium]